MGNGSNPLLDYIGFLHSHEKTHCCEKLGKAYFNDLEPIARGQSDKYYLDEKAAEKVVLFIQGEIPDLATFNLWMSKVPSKYRTNADKCRYIEKFGHKNLGYIRQSKGDWADLPLVLEPFQKAIIYAMYGIKRRSDGKRRFKETWIEIGRKNGKTTLQAALALYALFEESGAEIYLAAKTLDQSTRMWNQCRDMARRSPQLSKVLRSHVNPRPEIMYDRRASKIVAVSGDASNLDGLNSSFIVIDEAHELPDDNYAILKQATANSRQPMTVIITTAGEKRGALFDNKYEYYSKVLDGLLEDDSVLILIYELDDRNEMWNPDRWYKANPSLGVMKTEEYLADMVNQAKGDKSHVSMLKTLTKDFNVVGVKVNAWLDAETINSGAYACYDPAVIDDPERCEEFLKRFDNTVVIGGFDLSKIGDLTAFTILLFDKENDCVIAKTMQWCTKAFLETYRAKNTQVPWNAWIDGGWLRVSSWDNQIDYHEMTAWVMEELEKHGYVFEHINYDAWSAPYVVQELEEMGFSKSYCLVPTFQGAKTLSVPMQNVESRLKEKRLCYLDNPLVKWEFSNVALVPDRNGNYMPRKNDENGEHKIDGVASILNCFVSFCQNMDGYFDINGEIVEKNKSGKKRK